MSLYGHGIAAEFGKNYTAFFLFGHAEFAEIDMVRFEIEMLRALVVPAAHAVDKTGVVYTADVVGHGDAVELSPAFVEYAPQHDRRETAQVFYRVAHEFFVILPLRFVRARKCLVMPCIVEHDAHKRQRAYDGKVVLIAARNHILPHEHSQPVAMVVPARRLYLYVLADHVEAAVLHRLNVVYHRPVRRRGEHAFGIVTLVEHAALEDIFAVQLYALISAHIGYKLYFTHGEIGAHAVAFALYKHFVEEGRRRRPFLYRAQSDNVVAGRAFCGDYLPALVVYLYSDFAYIAAGGNVYIYLRAAGVG